MKKGSRKWFDEIVTILDERLVGIEVSHYSKDQAVIPKCQVSFVLNKFYQHKTPEDILRIREVEGFRMLNWVCRGGSKEDHSDMKTTVLFDFWDEEKCPRDIMIKVAKELSFTVAPEFLNSKTHTARLSPSIY